MSSDGSSRGAHTLSFPSFLSLPTDLQHLIWIYGARRKIALVYSVLCKEISQNIRPLIQRQLARRPNNTKKEMFSWIRALSHVCANLRERVVKAEMVLLEARGEIGGTMPERCMLFIEAVPPKTGPPADPLSAVPGSRAYTGDYQGPHRRALEKIRNLSTSDESSSILIPLHPNVLDTTHTQSLSGFHEGSARKILTQLRWVLNAYGSLFKNSLVEQQRQAMDLAQEKHEELLNAGQTSSFDYCDFEDVQRLELQQFEAQWTEDQEDLIFEMKYVLSALLTYSAGNTEQPKPLDEASAASSAASSSSIPPTDLLLYTKEQLHIHDPSQDLSSTEGVIGGRYHASIFVLPFVKSQAQEVEEREVQEAIDAAHAKAAEYAMEAERARQMHQRWDASASASVAPASFRSAKEIAEAELNKLRLICAMKGVELTPEQEKRYETNIAEAEARDESFRQQQESIRLKKQSESGSVVPVSIAPSQLEGYDHPYFLIATTNFRDEKRANNSRKSVALR